MAMPHFLFTLLNFALLLVILLIDRKHLKDYLFIGVLGLVLDLIFEQIPVRAGFWVYNSEPIIFGISFYVWILYLPYLSICYFLGNRLGKFNG
ncbi:hypothetical protein HYV85_02520 [Candidatus Woesearchaeota archaeon]|nr:hypothetical protein [Candidatus Woesearchaeota archaeon]